MTATTRRTTPDTGTFDPGTHTYRLASDGSRVQSVTQVLNAILPGWQAGEWYLQRGQAVHACASYMARGIPFDHDMAIDGQVTALRRFFREIAPEVISVEEPLFSNRYGYAGTPDLIATIGGKTMIVDWKASIPATLPYQLAAYGLLANVKYGVGVHIRDDGIYKMTDVYALKRYQPEWLAMRTTYGVMERLGAIKEPKQERDDG